MLAALADMAMGQALRNSSGDDDVPATSQLTVTYLRPGQPGRLVELHVALPNCHWPPQFMVILS